MLRLLLSAALFSSLLTGDALAGGQPPRRPSAAPPHASTPPGPKADPAKLRDCEQAWARQRVKKGSRKAFIRACVRHG
jgi:hypothetical protein